MGSRVRVRFAPSPTGLMHIGGLRTALVNFMFSLKHNGQFILRIEDTDKTRFCAAGLNEVFNSLDWAGIKTNENPRVGGTFGPYTQSERTEIYRKYASRLVDKGHAYPCFCSPDRLEVLRSEQRMRSEVVRYDGRCQHLSKTKVELNLAQNIPHVLRFKMSSSQTSFNDFVFGEVNFPGGNRDGDPIIMKSDGLPVYHLANVVDDHLMQISHVIRGSEWVTAVPMHLQLYRAFGWKPPAFAHLPLMLSSSGKKFSKRASDPLDRGLVRSLREAGYLPSAVLCWLSATGGLFTSSKSSESDVKDNAENTFDNINEFIRSSWWKPDKSIGDMLDSFDLTTICRHHARVNLDLLQLCGRAHFDRLADQALDEALRLPSSTPYLCLHVRQYLQQFCDSAMSINLPEDNCQLSQMLHRLKGRVHSLSDLTSEFGFLWRMPKVTNFIKSPNDDAVLISLAKSLESDVSLWQQEDRAKQGLMDFCKISGFSKSRYMKLIRLCLTASEIGMPVHELIVLLSPAESAHRIRKATELLSE